MPILLFLFVNMLHPVYVSVTNMDVCAAEGRVTVAVKTFTEDMETMLHNKYSVHAWLGTSAEHIDARRLIDEYVRERITVDINRDGRLTLATDSIIRREEALWVYLSGRWREPIRHLDVTNRLLTDFFSQQTNLLIIGEGGREEGFQLDSRNMTAAWDVQPRQPSIPCSERP